MKICTPGPQSTVVAASGEGQSCAIVVAQQGTDPGGWYFELQAEGEQGFFLVRRLFLTPPLRVPSRCIATATFPTARRWQCLVQAPAAASLPIRVALAASDAPFSPGLLDPGQPGSKGFDLDAATGAANVNVPPGARMRTVSAIGLPAGTGTITLEVWRDAVTFDTIGPIPLPAAPAPGVAFDLPREDLDGACVRRVLFANTVSYYASWVE